MEALLIPGRCNIPVVSVDYRMPPNDPFPAGLEDAIAVSKEILIRYPAGSLTIGETSAGGGLTLATALKWSDLGIELPGAPFTGTPWTDLAKAGNGYFISEGIDHLLVTNDGLLKSAARLLLYCRWFKTRFAMISTLPVS